jgi:hypothetical protein
VQPDSIIPDLSNPQSWNRFSYGLNRPLTYIDPSGHDPILFLLLAAVAILATACAPLETSTPTSPPPTPHAISTVPGTLPISRFEPSTNWDGDHELTTSTNCYAYALDLKKDPRTERNFIFPPQPGEFSGYAIQHYPDWDWKKAAKLMTDDVVKLGRSIMPGSRDEPCPENHYKIALFEDPLGDNNGYHDLHFYRQDPNGLWSHKQGSTVVSSLDFSNKIVFDPQIADRRNKIIPEVNYTTFGGYYCISTPH